MKILHLRTCHVCRRKWVFCCWTACFGKADWYSCSGFWLSLLTLFKDIIFSVADWPVVCMILVPQTDEHGAHRCVLHTWTFFFCLLIFHPIRKILKILLFYLNFYLSLPVFLGICARWISILIIMSTRGDYTNISINHSFNL